MAKNFPYFKFVASEWLTGDIVFEEMAVQGLFINICALYWQRDGKLTIDEINKRYKHPKELEYLSDRFISLNGGFVSVSFLDEQLIQAEHISINNSKNGKLGGRPKATAKRNKANKNKKKNKEEEDKNKKLTLIPLSDQLKSFAEENTGKYSKEMMNSFFMYWNAKVINGSKSELGKPRWETEKTFDLTGRLATWFKRSNNESPQSGIRKVKALIAKDEK